MTDRIVSRRPLEEDQQWEPTLRPKIWDEYIGQEKVKENLRVFIEAARARREPLDHVLLHGPPGLGKTTLAYLIATELQVGIRATSVSVSVLMMETSFERLSLVATHVPSASGSSKVPLREFKFPL